jgi:hypothetical protein
MTATGKWVNVASVFTDGTTEFNSLANNTRAFGTGVNNNSNLNRYADFELKVKFASRPTSTSPYLNLYLVPAIGGVTYLFSTVATTPPITIWAGSFPVQTSTGPQQSFIGRAILPPLQYKSLLENKSGKTLAATGTVLKSRAYN